MRRQTLTGGLAASAVGALALTGLAVAPAGADEPVARWVSQFTPGHLATARQDASALPGPSSAVSLTVEVPDTTAVVVFEFNTDAGADDSDLGWTPIASPSTVGVFRTVDWSPPSAVVDTGDPVGLRVVVTPPGGSPAYATRRDVVIDGPASPTNGVELSGKGGYFVQPYADSARTRTLLAVPGTTSATDGQVAISWRPENDVFGGEVQAAVEQTSLKIVPGSYLDAGRFAAALDITAFDAHNGDVVALAATRDTDDVMPVSLHPQEPRVVTASVPAEEHRVADITVTVRDGANDPVAGVEVRRASDGALVGYTDGHGEVAARQQAGTTDRYYANVSDVDELEVGTDPATTDVSVPDFVAEATGVVPVLAHGVVFDRDEYADGDVALQVVDQDGEPYAGETPVGYALYPTGTTAPDMTTETTDASGRLLVLVDATGPAGSYTLDYSTPDTTSSTTFTLGDATLGLTPANATAASGGRVAFTGTLALGGTPLAGRTVQLAYVRGTEAAPGTGADAGMSGTADPLTGTAVTGADGSFTVTVVDPAEAGGPAETGGRLTATAVGTSASAGADFTAAPTPAQPAQPAPPAPPTPPTPGTGGGSAATSVRLKLTGTSKKGMPDRLHVTSAAAAAGAKVTVLRLTGHGKKAAWKPVATRPLDAKGTATVTVPDRNGRRKTSYRVELAASSTVLAATSPVCKVS
jgi:hypothetical protein